MADEIVAELSTSASLEMIRREHGSLTRALERRGLKLPGRSAKSGDIPGFMSVTLFNPPTAEFYTEYFRSPVSGAIELNRFGPADQLQVAWEKIVLRYAEIIDAAVARFAANVDAARMQFFSNGRDERIRATMALHRLNAAELALRPFADGLSLLSRLIPAKRSVLFDEIRGSSGRDANVDGAAVQVVEVLREDFSDQLHELNVVLDVLNCLPWVFPDLNYKTLIEKMAESWSSGRQCLLRHPEIREGGEYYRVCVPLWNPHLVSNQAWIAGAIHVGFRPNRGGSDDLLNGVIADVCGLRDRIEHKVEAARFESAVRRLHGTPASDDQVIDAMVDMTGCRAVQLDDRFRSIDGREHDFVHGDPVVELSLNRGDKMSNLKILPWLSQSDEVGVDEAAEATRDRLEQAIRMAVPIPEFSHVLLRSRIRELRCGDDVAPHDNHMICFLIVADLVDRYLTKQHQATGVSDFLVNHHLRFAVRQRGRSEAHWGMNKLLSTQLGDLKSDLFAYQYRDGGDEQYRLKLGRGGYPASSVTRDCLQGKFGELFLLQTGLRARFVLKADSKSGSNGGSSRDGRQVDAVEIWRAEDHFDARNVMKAAEGLTSESDLSADLLKLGVDFR